MKYKIDFLTPEHLSDYVEHLHTHMSESGIDDIVYTPFEIGFNHPKEKMKEKITERFGFPLDKTNWQRAFVATVDEKIVGHLDLQGHHLESSLHRCRLGMGLDKGFRSKGIGSKLMKAAIDWVTNTTSIDWIDLYTFEHNESAIALYKKFGFVTVGKVEDLFRVNGQKISDYQMVLNVRDFNILGD